jgi:hypothetical protein
MAFANCNSQNFCYFNNPESEPDQDYAQTYTNYDSFWKLNEFDWSDFDCLNGASIGMDWMWQPLDNTMALSPGTGLTEFDSIPDANQDAAFLSNSTQIWSPGTMTHPPKLLPPETSSTNSPSSTTPLTTSLLESPAISSILLPQSTSSSPPEPKALYTCTICQPHRCYSKPQYPT